MIGSIENKPLGISNLIIAYQLQMKHFKYISFVMFSHCFVALYSYMLINTPNVLIVAWARHRKTRHDTRTS